jgi:hypothetical protein
MRIHLLPSICFFILLGACKKNNDPASSKELFYKEVGKRGNDSIVSNFWYDGMGRLSKGYFEESFGGQTSTLTVTRDNNGRVSRIVWDIKGPTSATSIMDFFFQSANGPEIKYAKAINGVGSQDIVLDSMIYEYSGAVVTGMKHYYSWGGPYVFQAYYTYSYDSRNNITSYKHFVPDAGGSGVSLRSELIMTYDDKINPYNVKDDAFIEFLDFPWPSPNNMTSKKGNPGNPPGYVVNNTYEYRADGRPTRRTEIYNGRTTEYTYYYR